jgi:hypothetical protein
MKEYKFNQEDEITMCIACPCMQPSTDVINGEEIKWDRCGINEMPLIDSKDKNFHCPLIEVK